MKYQADNSTCRMEGINAHSNVLPECCFHFPHHEVACFLAGMNELRHKPSFLDAQTSRFSSP